MLCTNWLVDAHTLVREFRSNPPRMQIPRGALFVITNVGGVEFEFGAPASLLQSTEHP